MSVKQLDRRPLRRLAAQLRRLDHDKRTGSVEPAEAARQAANMVVDTARILRVGMRDGDLVRLRLVCANGWIREAADRLDRMYGFDSTNH